MGPASPASIPCWVTSSSLIMPLPIVLTTWVPSTKAATKLKNAAQATALLGDSTRVETAVAAVISGVLYDDVADDVRIVLALVAGVLEPVVDLFPLHDLQRIAPVRPE